MLVLTRRRSDQILIPSLGITLEVLSIKGNVVKLGIRAPQEVRILRGELTGTAPASTKAQFAAESVVKKGQVPKRSSSLKDYLQRTEQHEKESSSTRASVAASHPILFLPEESSELIRESTAAYEVCA